jgi:DNA processing protein
MTGPRAPGASGAPGVPGWLDPQDERTARAAWSRLAEPGDRAAGRVLARLGAGPALLALLESPRAVTAAAAGPRAGAVPGEDCAQSRRRWPVGGRGWPSSTRSGTWRP